MKRNKMMRLASAMMVTTLMTTSVISGTFAKYVSETSASDNARVAKWGVKLAANGLLYSEQYDDYAHGNDGVVTDGFVTVETYQYNNAAVKQSVVAPGTKNETGFTFTVDGRPEVDVEFTGSLNAATTVLPDATYYVHNSKSIVDGGEVDGSENVPYTLNAEYYPVKYTLKKDGTALITGTLLDVCEKLDELFAHSAVTNSSSTNTVTYTLPTTLSTKVCEANTDLGTLLGAGSDGVYTLTWEWAIQNSITNVDVFDTFLGDLAYAAVGQDGSEISGAKIICYANSGKTEFYSLDAYAVLSDAEKSALSEVTTDNCNDFGIGITESFALSITATQID